MKPKTHKKKAEKPLIKGTFLLEKFPGKGGWTFVTLPKPPDMPKAPFGARYVKGTVDKLNVTGLSIWSTKTGNLFFPIKAALRKQLGKEEGDTVKLVLYHDAHELVIPEDFDLVLKEEPLAAKKFRALSRGRQWEMVNWIQEAKRTETRINRMAEALKTLAGD